MSLGDNRCSFYHVRRTTNVFAHQMATLHCEIEEHFIWGETLTFGFCNPNLLLLFIKIYDLHKKKISDHII